MSYEETASPKGPRVIIERRLFQLFPKLNTEALGQLLMNDLDQVLKFLKFTEDKRVAALHASPVRSLELRVKRRSSRIDGFWEPEQGRMVVYVNVSLFEYAGKLRQGSGAGLRRVFRHELGHAFHQLLAELLKTTINHERVYSSEAFAEMVYVILDNGCDSERIRKALSGVVIPTSIPFGESTNYPYPPDNDVKKLDAAMLFFVYKKHGLKQLLQFMEMTPANSANFLERARLLPYLIKRTMNPELKWPNFQSRKMKSRLLKLYDYLGTLVGSAPRDAIATFHNFYRN